MEFPKDKKNIIYLAIIFIVGFFGAYLRFRAYFINPSMWYDEVSLALNVQKNIFLPPLLNNQSAPFLFLVLAKICSFFSYSNFSFRFIPFISGLLSIPVFYIYAKTFIKSKTGLILALFLFCINFRLIYFSREFKPYAVDVLIFMFALISYFKIDFSKINLKTYVLSGLAFAISPLLSFSSFFILPACYLFSILKAKQNFRQVIAFLAPGLVLIPVYYFMFLRNYSQNEYFQRFWSDGFVTFKSLLPAIIKMFDYFLEPTVANIFFLASVIFGFILCIKQNKEKTLFLICSFIFVLLASFLHKYPLQERLVLFLISPMLVFSFKIFDIKTKHIWISILLFILSFGHYIKADFDKIFNNESYYRESITGLMDTLKTKYQKGEYILPLPWSDVAFMHYNKIYKFDETHIIKSEINHKINYTKPFWNAPKGRYWLIFTIQSDNYLRYVDLQKWLERDFELIKVYKDHQSRMYYAEKTR